MILQQHKPPRNPGRLQLYRQACMPEGIILLALCDSSLSSSEKLLKISKVSYAWKTYRKHFSRSLDFVEIIPRPRLVPL